MTEEGVVALATEQSLDINATSREVTLANTDIDALRKQALQLGSEGSQFTLSNPTILLLTSLSAATTTATPALGFIKVITVILNTKILSGRTQPVVLCRNLLLGEIGVSNLFG